MRSHAGQTPPVYVQVVECGPKLVADKLLRQGVEVWNAWRVKEPSVEVDLSEAYLYHASLCRAILSELSETNLSDANLYRADLREALLPEANLRGADLSEARLRGADLQYAYLGVAHLRGADLRRADIRWATLRGADLRGANLREAESPCVPRQNCRVGGLTRPPARRSTSGRVPRASR